MRKIHGKNAAFELNELQRCGDLIYYEGSLLTHYMSEDGNHYLVCWVDADELCNRWIIFRTNISSLRKYLAKEITLRHLVCHPADHLVWVADIDNNEVQHNTQVLQPDELPEEYIPAEDSYYAFEHDDPTLQEGTDYYEIGIPPKDRSLLSMLIKRMGWSASLVGKVAL